jgi:hypothetical protein
LFWLPSTIGTSEEDLSITNSLGSSGTFGLAFWIRLIPALKENLN